MKELLIDSIILRGVSDMRTCIELTHLGYMRFTGNQWNEDWSWNREALERLSVEELEIVREDPTRLFKGFQ